MFFSIAWRNAKRSRSENLIYFLTMVTAIATFYIVLSLGEQDVMRFLSELESDAVDRLLTKLLPTVYLCALLFVFSLVIFCIPRETVEKNGLLQSIMQAEKLLKPSGLYYESYLDNFGRQLFYVISGSYTTLYMGFMLLIIACAVLALQFLTQMRATRARYVYIV